MIGENAEATDPEEVGRPKGMHFDWRALLAGAAFIASLATGGFYISNTAGTTATSIVQSYTPLLVSLFIGSSVGHYYGKALEKPGSSVNSAYLGAFSMLVIIWIYQVRISPLTASLVCMAAALILAHGTDLIEESKHIKKGVDIFAEGISPFGLVLVAALRYVFPGSIDIEAIGRVIIGSLTQKVSFFGASVNVVLFFIGVGILVFVAVVAFAASTSQNQ